MSNLFYKISKKFLIIVPNYLLDNLLISLYIYIYFFFVSRNTIILIKTKFWLRIYDIRNILNKLMHEHSHFEFYESGNENYFKKMNFSPIIYLVQFTFVELSLTLCF